MVMRYLLILILFSSPGYSQEKPPLEYSLVVAATPTIHAEISKAIFGLALLEHTLYNSKNINLIDGKKPAFHDVFKTFGAVVFNNTAVVITGSAESVAHCCGMDFSFYFAKKNNGKWRYSFSYENIFNRGYWGEVRKPELVVLGDKALFSIESGSMFDGIKFTERSYILIWAGGLIGKTPVDILTEISSEGGGEKCPHSNPYPHSYKTNCYEFSSNLNLKKLDGIDYVVVKYDGSLKDWKCDRSVPIEGTFKWAIRQFGIESPIGGDLNFFWDDHKALEAKIKTVCKR